MRKHRHPWEDGGAGKHQEIRLQTEKILDPQPRRNADFIAQLLMARAKACTLNPEIIAALLLGVEIAP